MEPGGASARAVSGVRVQYVEKWREGLYCVQYVVASWVQNLLMGMLPSGKFHDWRGSTQVPCPVYLTCQVLKYMCGPSSSGWPGPHQVGPYP